MEKLKMAKAVLAAKRVPPRKRHPRMKRGMFPARTMMPIGHPVKLLMIWERPLTPPLASLAGIKNTRKAPACRVAPIKMRI